MNARSPASAIAPCLAVFVLAVDISTIGQQNRATRCENRTTPPYDHRCRARSAFVIAVGGLVNVRAFSQQTAAPRRRGRSRRRRPTAASDQPLVARSTSARALVQQQRSRRVDVAVIAGDVQQRRHIRSHFPVDLEETRLCPATAAPVDVALLAGGVQRRHAALCPPDRPPRLCPATAAPSDVAVVAGDVQRRRAVLVRPIDLRAFVQQQPRRVDVALLAGGEQRRPPSQTSAVRPIEQRRRTVLIARSTSAPLSSNSRAAST